MKISVLISGRGSNLLSLIENQDNFEITSVISNKKKAPGLEYAKQYNIPSFIFDKLDYNSLSEAKFALFEKLKELNPDLIVLAGFLQIISPEMVNYFNRKIINIHPALLPEYAGLAGMDAHKKVLLDKKKIHGCTVHLVDNGLDTGDIIQTSITDISDLISVEEISDRILKLEHNLYPWVINNIANGNIILEPNIIKKINYET